MADTKVNNNSNNNSNGASPDDDRGAAKHDLLSGVLLNHCLIYGNLGGDLGYNEATEVEGSKECAFFLCKLSATSLAPALGKPVSFGRVDKYLNSECQLSEDSIIWIHISNAIMMRKIVDHFRLSPSVYKAFLDSTPMWRFQPLNDGTSFFFDTCTAQLLDTHLNIRKTHCYCTKGLILTFENRMHAKTVDGSVPGDKSSASPLMRGISITSISDANSQQDARGASNSMTNNIYALNGQTVQAGEFFDTLLKRINDESVQAKIVQHGSLQIVFEALLVNFLMLKPILRFYSREMLRLHNDVFVRKNKPGYLEGMKLKEDIDSFKCCYKLLNNVVLAETKSSMKLFKDFNSTKINSWCVEEFGDTEFELSKITSKIDRLHIELDRIDENLDDLIKRRNDRIDLMLSIAATTFLPLSFLTGVFGMNFNKGGLLVYILEADEGSLAFWVLSILLILILLWWYHKSDFFSILSAKERNKHVQAFEKQNVSREKGQGGGGVDTFYSSAGTNGRPKGSSLVDEDDFSYKVAKDDSGSNFHASLSSLTYKQNLIGNKTIQNSSNKQ